MSFVLEGWQNLLSPMIALERPDLTVEEICMSGDTASFPTDSPGVYWIEVLDVDESGPGVELLFPVVAGGTATDVLEGGIPYALSDARTADRVTDELNSFRTSMGLPPLHRDALLDSLAQLRAGDLALTGGTTHYSSDGSGIAELLPGGWDLWVRWHEFLNASGSRNRPDETEEFDQLQADRGRHLGFVRMVARRGPEEPAETGGCLTAPG